ncbi:hypothetical protein Tco_0373160 [Tanacetum coccineum]
MFIDLQFTWDYDSQMTEKYFAEYTRIEVVSSKALDASLVVTECSGTKSDEHITSSSLGTYITHVVDADIRPVNDQVSSAEVHLTAQHNVLANEQQHTDQSEPSYDTYLLEKVDSNTTLDSTNISHKGGELDQDAEQDQVKSSLLKAEFLKMNDMEEKRVLPRIHILVIFLNGGSSVSDLDSKFSSAVIAMNSSNSAKSFSSRMVHSMEWRISLPSSRRASKSSSKISSKSQTENVSSFDRVFHRRN